MDAANIDLKGFTEGFYKNLCSAALAPVLETLEYLKHETDVWFEITTLLIPGENDLPGRDRSAQPLGDGAPGPDVPLHFTAFHPDWKMRDTPPTPPATLHRARRIAREAGPRYVYTGNIHDPAGQSDLLPWLRRGADRTRLVRAQRLESDGRGRCGACGTAVRRRVRGSVRAVGVAPATHRDCCALVSAGNAQGADGHLTCSRCATICRSRGSAPARKARVVRHLFDASGSLLALLAYVQSGRAAGLSAGCGRSPGDSADP